jgi:hypothetical protein
MLKYIFVCLMMLVSPSIAKTLTVPVYTKSIVSSPAYVHAQFMMRKLNEMQNDYEFILQTISGAQGESADLRTIAEARAGRKVMLLAPSSSFTLNKLEFGNTYDRDNDLITVSTTTASFVTLVVHENSGIKTVEELINRVKKKKSYIGFIDNSGAPVFLAKLMVKHYGLDATFLNYKDYGTVNRMLEIGEIDFSLKQSSGLLPGEKVLNDSRTNRANIPNFKYDSLSLFVVPKELKQFGKELEKYFITLCQDKEVIALAEKVNTNLYCMNDQAFKYLAAEQLKLIETFK